MNLTPPHHCNLAKEICTKYYWYAWVNPVLLRKGKCLYCIWKLYLFVDGSSSLFVEESLVLMVDGSLTTFVSSVRDCINSNVTKISSSLRCDDWNKKSMLKYALCCSSKCVCATLVFAEGNAPWHKRHLTKLLEINVILVACHSISFYSASDSDRSFCTKKKSIGDKSDFHYHTVDFL